MIRDEAIKILDDVIPPPDHATVDLDHLPIAQAWVVIKNELKWKRKTGEWINVTNDESLEEEYECSVCGYELFYSNPTKFCPNCGADMRGGNNETP